ncbi:amino acid adenylation domain-containing protein [Streptomyces sp. NPDC046371]|uniref:amino acid adenylation domain-containing protein n=1 Tax=Streptomyces sp. NPDC046371 TaxID=3154916 RepID=UPI0034104733
MTGFGPGGLVARLAEHALSTPGKVALSVAPVGGGDRVDLSYAELTARSRAVARALLAKVRPGARVLLLFPTAPEFAPAFLGCLAAGVVAVPVPLPLDEGAQRRVLNVARDCDVSLVVSLSFVRDFVLAGEDPELRAFAEAHDWLLADRVGATAGDAADSGFDDGAGLPVAGADDIAFLQYTSGSTSTPRGVVVTHGALMHNEAAIQRSFGVRQDSTIVSWLPLHHDMGLIGAMLQPLYSGARGVVLDPLSFLRSPASWLRTISEEGADISGGPNFAYDLCVRKVTEEEKAGLDLSRWRVAFNGAAQVYPRTLRAFSQAFRDTGFRAEAHLPCYGLAESTLLVTTVAPGVSRTFEDGRELTAYRLPDHADVRVVDRESGAEVTAGEVGEIAVAGGSNGTGYWGQEPFGEFLRTGDLGFRDGEELFVVGRSKDLIVQRGRNIYPEDLEADAGVCDPDVRPGRTAVFGVENEPAEGADAADGDESVVVCQEVQPRTAPARYGEIAARVRATLSRVHGVTARTVLLVPPGTITKTSSGKVQRYAARQRHLAGELPVLLADTLTGRGSSLTERLAGAPLTAALCAHIGELLGLPEAPAPDASLADLGADSLTAVRVRQDLADALGVELAPTVALRAGSIGELAALAEAAGAAPAPAAAGATGTTPSPASAEGPGGYALNASQRALWFLHRAAPGGDYNVTRAFRVTGTVEPEAFRTALAAVADRHPSLRLALTTRDGAPHAEVRDPSGADAATVDLATVDARTWDADREGDWYREFATRPFDLAAGTPLRAALLRRDADWLFALSLHHLVCDVSSFALVVADLAAALDGETLAPSAVPAPAPEPDHGAFWRAELDGELPTLTLPNLGATAAPSPGAARESLAFSVPAAPLAAYARAHGLTLHNLLLAAYQVLLHRLSGQADLLVGVPYAGRTDRARADWVGYLVNVVPVRSAYSALTPFGAFAAATHRHVLDVLDHADQPLSEIVRTVNPDRDSATATVFQAMFTCYTASLPGAAAVVTGDERAALPAGAATLHGHRVPDHTTQSDLGLNVAVRDDVLDFQLQYDDARVTREQAELVARTLPTLLAGIGADGDGPLPLLTPDEAAVLLARAVGPDVPRPENYLDSFERWADRTPDAVAVDDGTVTLTYAELDARANHAAERLRAAGVATDRTVVMSADRSADYLVALVALHKADGAYVPISPREAPLRAEAMVEAVRPAAIIATPSGRHLFGDRPVFDLAELASGSSTTRPPRLCHEHATSTIIHTSGSTGVPKAAVSTNYGVTNHMWQMAEHFALTEHDCVAQTAPVSFDISVWQLLTPIMIGGRVRIVPEPDSQSPASLLKAVADGGVTMLELVPSNIVALLDAGLAASPGALRVMLSTGESLTQDVLRRWVRELPAIPVHNAYGPAECTDDVTAGLCGSGPDGPLTTAVGLPLANTTVHVLDEHLQPVPAGVVGLLYVGGGAVGRGYRGNPRRTAEMFVPDPYAAGPGGRLYRTGDLGRVNADGDLEFLGRADTQIKIRGQRIEVGEVESALRRCPGVVEAAVKVHTGPAGASLVGYVSRPGGPEGPAAVLDLDEDERFRAVLAERLPRHMIPTIIAELGRLPRSKNGKVDYRSLEFTAPETTRTSAGLDDPLAATVRSLWAELLERAEVGWDDSFFQLGGHSLLALTMIDRVAALLGVRLEVDAVFARPRLRDFVAAVREADPATARHTAERPPADPTAPVPASAAQQRFWFLREMDPDSPTYNMPGVLRLRGDLDEEALETALRDTLAAHPVLLARFATDGGELTWTARPAEEFALDRLDLRGPVAELGDEVFDRLVADEAAVVADLRREPPFRALLARLGERDWGLFVNIDHIACDGWSLTVFLSGLADRYNGLKPPASGYGFADYCHDERSWWERRDRTELAALWQDVTGRRAALAPLPDRAAPPAPDEEEAGKHTDVLDAGLGAAVRELAGSAGVTPYMVFATALAALAHSGSDERELVMLGTLIAQRDRPEWRQVVGPLLNVSVLAVELSPADPVSEALAAVRAGALRAYRCAHVPFQELVPLLTPTPDGDGSPFDVMLVMQPPGTPVELAGLEVEPTDLDAASAPYPLLVDVEERDGGYRVSYRYRTGRFDAAGVAELADRVRTTVRALVTAGAAPLAELVPAGTAAERS